MNLALGFDSETTGLPIYNSPSEDPSQPHIVQLAAVLIDVDTGAQVSCMDVIVKPDGWEIPEQASAIHGITTERALAVGVPEPAALAMFLALWNRRLRIAHNQSFDERIIRIALKRYGEPATADIWKDSESACTMQMSTPILKLPSEKRSGYKWPKLTEAYKHFTGQDLVGAHSAMADAQACLTVYRAIKYPATI